MNFNFLIRKEKTYLIGSLLLFSFIFSISLISAGFGYDNPSLPNLKKITTINYYTNTTNNYINNTYINQTADMTNVAFTNKSNTFIKKQTVWGGADILGDVAIYKNSSGINNAKPTLTLYNITSASEYSEKSSRALSMNTNGLTWSFNDPVAPYSGSFSLTYSNSLGARFRSDTLPDGYNFNKEIGFQGSSYTFYGDGSGSPLDPLGTSLARLNASSKRIDFFFNITAPNVCYSNGTGCSQLGNSSFNQSLTDSKYIPYTNASSNVDLNNKNITNFRKISNGDSTNHNNAEFGTFGLQSYAVNNGWLSDNAYFDGSNFLRRVNGFATLTRFTGSTNMWQIQVANTGAAGSTFSPLNAINVRYNGGYPATQIASVDAVGTYNAFSVFDSATADNLASTQLNPISASGKPLVVQGYTSQSANLTEWQSSDGTVLSWITKIGSIHTKSGLEVNGTTILDGNVNITGNATYTSFYGGMWMHNDSGLSGTFNSTYQKLYFDISNNVNGFTFANSTLKLISSTGSGLYQANYKLEGEGVQNHEYHSYVFINEVQQNNTIGHAIGQASSSVQIEGLGMIRINLNDNITVRLADLTSSGAGKQIDANINLIRIAN